MTTSALPVPTQVALSPEIQNQLDALRDINLPDPVSWWPLAMGWWVVIGIVCAMIIGTVFYHIRRRRSIGFAALRELEALRRKAPHSDIKGIATDITVLLRRVAMRISGQTSGALKGDEWINYLTSGDQGMEPVVAEFLADAPYIAEIDKSAPVVSRLLDVSELWIRRHA